MKISLTRLPAVLALAVILISSPLAAVAQEKAEPGHGGHSSGEMAAPAVDQMMDHGSQLTKTYSDRAYLSAMIAHHEAAVDMAQTALKTARDQWVTDWARRIIDLQASEISQMRQWLEPMGGEDKQAAEAMGQAMRAMMSHKFSDEADLNFVIMMMDHHAGGVEMAVRAVVGSEEARVVELSRAIISAQVAEIVDGKNWLAKRAGRPAVF